MQPSCGLWRTTTDKLAATGFVGLRLASNEPRAAQKFHPNPAGEKFLLRRA